MTSVQGPAETRVDAPHVCDLALWSFSRHFQGVEGSRRRLLSFREVVSRAPTSERALSGRFPNVGIGARAEKQPGLSSRSSCDVAAGGCFRWIH